MLDGSQLPAYVRAWLDGNGCPPERAEALEGQVQALVDACEPYGGLRWPEVSKSVMHSLHMKWAPGEPDRLWVFVSVKTHKIKARWPGQMDGGRARQAVLHRQAAAYAARALNITRGPATL
jgi:hypothetical protein